MKEVFNPPAVKRVGPYSAAVRAKGTMVFVCGCAALDAEGNVVGKGDVEAQTRQVMENMKACLEAAGATFNDVCKIVTYVASAADFPKIAPIRAQYLKAPYPVSTLIEVKSLLYPDLLVEIDAIAVID